jgi:hypothetical protein
MIPRHITKTLLCQHIKDCKYLLEHYVYLRTYWIRNFNIKYAKLRIPMLRNWIQKLKAKLKRKEKYV